MRNALTLSLMLALFETGLYGRQAEPQTTAAAKLEDSVQSPELVPIPEPLVLHKGTLMCLFPDRPVSTRTAKAGERMSFHVGRDIEVNGVTLIAEGANVLGSVSEVLRPKIGRKDGKLSFAFESVPLVTGDKVPIQPAREIDLPRPAQLKRSILKNTADVLRDVWEDGDVIFLPLMPPFALLIPFEKGQEQVLFTSQCVPEETAQDVVLMKDVVLKENLKEKRNSSVADGIATIQSTDTVLATPTAPFEIGEETTSAREPSKFQTLAQWPGLLARGIAFTPEAMWVTRCDQNECGVTRIEVGSNKIVATIRTTKPPLGIAATSQGIWATIPVENSVIRIDPSSNEIVSRISVGKSPIGIAAGEGAIWVTNGHDKSVSRIDPQRNVVTATIGVGGFPGSIAVGDAAVWVANGEGCWGCSFGTISRIDPATNAVVKTIKTWKYGIEVHPSDLLVQDGSVWATAGEHVLRIDTQSNKIVKWIKVPLRKLFSMPEGLGPTKLHGLAIVDGFLWVAQTPDASLWKIDPRSNSLMHEPVLVGFPVEILGQSGHGDGLFWITNAHGGSTLKVKP